MQAKSLTIFFKAFRAWRKDHPVYGEIARGWLRTLLALAGPILAAIVMISLFEPVTLKEAVRSLQENPLLSRLPYLVVVLLLPFSRWQYARYLIPPAGATVFIFMAGASYVQDIFLVRNFSASLRYVFSSMFALFYPRVKIEGGEMRMDGKQTNLLDTVGGPGWALIQPGNSVVFRHLLEPSRASITRPYFMKPFETISYIASLDDQHGHVERLPTLTSDGIQVVVRDIHFRFHILTAEIGGQPSLRSPDHPYPFDEEAMRSMILNLSVSEDGLDLWHSAVQQVVVSCITAFINGHPITFLTSRRPSSQPSRVNLHAEAFMPEIRRGLRSLGAELIWIDVGQIDIIEEEADPIHMDFWPGEKKGDAPIQHAYADARRLKFQELGRAQCQAELVMSIVSALRDVNHSENPVQDSQRILVVRTAEILAAMNKSDAHGEGAG